MVNLVVNPGAETGTMYGWNDTGTTITTGWIAVQGGGCAHSGSWSFGTEAPTSAAAVMSQSLILEIGAVYTLSIWVKNFIGGPCSLACSIGEATLISVPSVSPTYTQYSSDFTANSVSEILQISGSATYMICTDDISVTFLSGSPSAMPTIVPTGQLSVPTVIPTLSPIELPSMLPSSNPTTKSSVLPSEVPSSNPSSPLSAQPSVQPTYLPTEQPSYQPTDTILTGSPTTKPTSGFSSLPSVIPTKKSTFRPTLMPSIQPTNKYSEDIMQISNVDLGNLKDGKQVTVAGANFDTAGFSVNGVGDINGDGISDIIIGAPGCSQIAATTCKSIDPTGGGKSYVVYGGQSSSIINLETLTIQQGFSIIGSPQGNVGFSVKGAGDFNGDGSPDMIIGAPGNATNKGEAYVIFGKNTSFTRDIYLNPLSLSQGFTIYGINAGDKTGYSVSGIGDINNDHFDDIIIGAIGNKTSIGKTFVIFGNNFSQNIHLSGLTMPQGFTISGANAGDNSGWSVSGAGNVNNDEYDDFIIGVPKSSSSLGIYTGISYVFYGNKTSTFGDINLNNSINGFTITGSAADAWSGFSVSAAGDFNDDGCDDIIIGAPAVNTGDGQIYVIFGCQDFANVNLASTNSNVKWVTITGASIFDYSGTSVSGAGDVNGDGIDDVIIGAPGATDFGAAYVVFGSKKLANLNLEALSYNNKVQYNSPGFSIIGANYADRAGFAVGNVSDFNNDGYADVTVGAPGAGSTGFHNGLSYVVYGGEMPPEDKGNGGLTENEKKIIIGFVVPFGLIIIGGVSYYFYHEYCYDRANIKDVTDLHNEYERINEDIKRLYTEDLEGIEIGTPILLIEQNEMITKTRTYITREFTKYINGKTATTMPRFKYKELRQEINELLSRKLELVQEFHIKRNLNFIRNNGFNIDAIQEKLSSIKKTISESKLAELDSTLKTIVSELKIQHQSQRDFKSEIQRRLHEMAKDLNNIKSFSVDKSPLLSSIDAMMDPKYVEAQNAAFLRFSNHLTHFFVKDLPKDISWLLAPAQFEIESLFLENYNQENKALSLITKDTLHTKNEIPIDKVPFIVSNDLMLSLLSARQMVEYLPMIKFVIQNAIDQFGYNITLPEILENKAALLATHLLLGNAAAYLLPTDFLTTGLIVSNIGTGAYAIKLMSIDQLNAQYPTDEPMEIVIQCSASIFLYNLPNIATYMAVQLILPRASYGLSGYDILASSSLGIVHCSSSYKLTEVQASESTFVDTAVPFIVDTLLLLALGSRLELSTTTPSLLLFSIKNILNTVSIIHSADSITKMIMHQVPQEIKENYIDSILENLYTAIDSNMRYIDNNIVGNMYNFLEYEY